MSGRTSFASRALDRRGMAGRGIPARRAGTATTRCSTRFKPGPAGGGDVAAQQRRHIDNLIFGLRLPNIFADMKRGGPRPSRDGGMLETESNEASPAGVRCAGGHQWWGRPPHLHTQRGRGDARTTWPACGCGRWMKADGIFTKHGAPPAPRQLGRGANALQTGVGHGYLTRPSCRTAVRTYRFHQALHRGRLAPSAAHRHRSETGTQGF